MPWRARKSLAKALLPSSCAAAAVGPKMRRPAARKRSTTPATSGTSGPTTVRATSSSRASCSRPSRSSTLTAALRQRASVAVPALPGATITSDTRRDCASFQASACSRPPEPMTRTFMLDSCARAAAPRGWHLAVAPDRACGPGRGSTVRAGAVARRHLDLEEYVVLAVDEAAQQAGVGVGERRDGRVPAQLHQRVLFGLAQLVEARTGPGGAGATCGAAHQLDQGVAFHRHRLEHQVLEVGRGQVLRQRVACLLQGLLLAAAAGAQRQQQAAGGGAARDRRHGGAFRAQCLKWRTPVNTMAMPCSSAAAITSASRIEPPGWITALMPASAAASMPSRNGKNASEAITEPSTTRPASAALIPAMRAEYTRLICPAPTP